jgi:lysyl-tRNA synthetase class 2
MEVETPILSGTTATDLHLQSLTTRLDGDGPELYLQTSPEFHMKRMLAAGIGPIYQICKAVRGGESGRRHNPEFTILEWYRPGWNHHDLMSEVDDLLTAVLGTQKGERLSYAGAFERFAELDPHTAADDELRRRVTGLGIRSSEELDRDDLLNLVMTHVVESRLGRERPTFIDDYPASQAALARVREEDPPVAERFEVFVAGLELANGYHELTDATEQRRRFERDREARSRAGLSAPPIDERLLAALEAGLPSCAGVALGVDRLVMLKLGTREIADVIAFPIDRA